MKQIPRKKWNEYIDRMSLIDETAGQKLREYMARRGLPENYEETQELIKYANALVMKYGEASAALACEMYDAISMLEGADVPPAEPAPLPEYGETAKAINGTLKKSDNLDYISGAVERLVKQRGADTMLQNAKRDNAEWAWIPNGDTCSFCITLASRGWQPASKAVMNGGHAEHIHAHCDCTFAIRHDSNMTVAGYDPDEYLEMYENADTSSYGFDKTRPKGQQWQNMSTAKINGMRRELYAKNKEKINAQKRVAYANRKALQQTEDNGRIKYEKSIWIPGNVGAMHKNTIIRLPDGTESRLTPHSKMEKIQVIAGKGRERQIDNIQPLLEVYKETADTPEQWQKVKGIGYVDYDGESYKADIHWYRHPKTGDVEHRIKPDQGGNWFYEDK